MATYSREKLRLRVLGRLGVANGEAAPDAGDALLVDEAIQQTFEELDDEGLIPFDWEADEIPAAYMVALSFLVAVPLVADFGCFAREPAIAAGAERGIRKLRRLKAGPYFGTTQTATYY